MLIKLRMIPHDKPLQVEFEIPAAVLEGERSQKSKFVADESFKEPAYCSFELKQKHRLDDVELEGEVTSKVDVICSRCGKEFKYVYQEHMFVMCVPKKELPRRGERPLQEDPDEEAQEGMVFFSHEEIDLAAIVREQILLNLPMRYICQEDCKGLCNACGEDLNLGEHQCKKAVAQKAN